MSDSQELQFRDIGEILKGAKNVLIASHQNPDPDAVSSVLTLNYVFKNMGLASFPYLPNRPAENLSFLSGFFDIKTEIAFFEPDVIFCLDYGDFGRLRLPERLLNKGNCRIVTIDHHLESDQRGEIRVLEPEVSSTSEIIYRWLKYANIEINQDIATLLLTGIFSDSGGFCHVATTSQTLNIVSELLLKGASLNKIASQTLDFSKPINLSRAWGYVLARTKLDQETGLAYSWVTPADLNRFEAGLADFDGITNIISAVSRINVGLFLIEYENGKIKGSLRSEPASGKNVAQIVRSLGGGGHPYAAGFSQEGTVQEVLKKVLNLIR
ncbi:MAG: bifunctional oligoribonuclease/PAP phosphatase NrnA [Candidatus Nealsonbacteria bacterium]